MSLYADSLNNRSASYGQHGEAANAFTRFVRARLRNWQKRRMIAAFERLDDRILTDIGLTRGDIPNVVEGLEPGGLRSSVGTRVRNGEAAPTRRLRQIG